MRKQQKKQNYLELTEVFRDPEVKVSHKYIASFFIVLSGVLLFSDKILAFTQIKGANTFGFTTYSNFIWVLTQSLSPIIMIVAYHFKPFIASFLVPLSIYTVQIVWIFRPDYYWDNPWLYLYVLLSAIAFVLVLIVFNMINNYTKTIKKDKEILKENLEVSIKRLREELHSI